MSQCWKAGEGQSKKQKILPIRVSIFDSYTSHGGTSLPLKGLNDLFYGMALKMSWGGEKAPPVMLHSLLQPSGPRVSHGVGC